MPTAPEAVFRLRIADGFATLRAVGGKAPLRGWDGTPRAAGWTPLEVEVDDDDGRAPVGDAPGFMGGPPVFAQTAVNALGPMLDADGELLALSGPPVPLYAFNCTRVVDALDLDASEVERFSDGGLRRVTRYALRPEAFGDAVLVRYTADRFGGVHVTDAFVRAWERAGLRGLQPDLEWRA